MFCEKCGIQLPEGAKFCAGCGARTETAPASDPVQAPAPPSPARPAQQTYAPSRPAAYAGPAQPGEPPLSVGQYIGMFLLMCVPVLNLVLLFVWGFGGSANLNRKNFARAALILAAVTVVLWILAGGVILSALESVTGGYY